MIPRAVAAALRLPLLTPDIFTATQWDGAEDKAKFGNQLLRFISEDFSKTLWKKPVYERLANTFSNIAHYDMHGFWETWFTTMAEQIEFLENIAQHHCFGDVAWTFSDVEKIVKARVRDCGIIEWKRKTLAEENKRRDLAELARLRTLYDAVSSPAALASAVTTPLPTRQPQLQTDLFGGNAD